MASIFQGNPLPSVSTTQTSTSTAPDWYSNYLSSLASGANAAVQQGGIAPFSPLQQQAFTAAPTAINAGQPSLTSGINTITGAAGGPNINQFMNPYTDQVVKSIGDLGQRTWQQTIAPTTTAGAVGTGQFGSSRGAQALANAGRDVNQNILAEQSKALQAGYQNAAQSALEEQRIQGQLGLGLGTLSGQAYTQGTGGLNILSALGAQEQALEQAKLNYPMTAQQNAASVVRGFQVPTSTSQTYSGPMPGAYGLSPLQQILGLTTGAGALFAPKYKADGTLIPNSGMIPGTLKGLEDMFPGLFRKTTSAAGTPGYTGTPGVPNYDNDFYDTNIDYGDLY